MDLRESTICQRLIDNCSRTMMAATQNNRVDLTKAAAESMKIHQHGTRQSIKSHVTKVIYNNNNLLLDTDDGCNHDVHSNKAGFSTDGRQTIANSHADSLNFGTRPETEGVKMVGLNHGRNNLDQPLSIRSPSKQKDSFDDLNNLLDIGGSHYEEGAQSKYSTRGANIRQDLHQIPTKQSKRPRRLVDKNDSLLVVAPQTCNSNNKYDNNNNNNNNNSNHKTSGSNKIEEPVCGCRCGQSLSKKDEVIQNNPQIPNIPKRTLSPPHKLVSLGERNGRIICNKHMPWFGIDVGGSLVKVVFFDPKDTTREEAATLKRIRRYLKSSKAYGTTGKRDAHLEMPNCVINKRVGSLHFIRFATNQMPDFLSMAESKRFTDTINTVCATGGGAYKFEEDIKNNLNITLHKTDELDSIIHGIHYIDKYNSDRECYFLEDPLDESKCVKVPYDFSRPYPYLVVNIGSGVSILAVYSSTCYSRISGSSIGGGTFLGLCCLLTQCKTFDEAIRLAKAGSSAKIDKLVKDIYGGDYPKFNLTGDTVASSFGHMNIAEKRKDIKREDLARALLEMVTINIGSIARMCAANENIDRVVFIGNFLRVNQLSMKLLSYAVNYWSKGAIKALFLEHEGYFGAVGCLVESIQLQ